MDSTVQSQERPEVNPTILLSQKWLELRNEMIRGAGWWASFTALYASTGSSCPCCGRVACPVGLSGAGIIGAGAVFLLRRGVAPGKDSRMNARETCPNSGQEDARLIEQDHER